MSFKRKFKEVKDKTVQLVTEHPMETFIIVSITLTATAKLINSITEARNSETWKREVERRERKTYSSL